jgi:AcrR family transcriptional regulator
MSIPHRILRQQAEEISPTIFTEKQEACEKRILQVAEGLMAQHGAGCVTAKCLAAALRMSPASLRWYFTDMHAVLGEILNRHLTALGRAVAAVPAGANRTKAARAAWLAYTRRPFAGFIQCHELLVRDRHLLPPDLRDPIEQRLHHVAMLVGPGREVETVALLDTPCLSPAQIEAMLATLEQPPQAEPATPLILMPKPAPETKTLHRWQTPPHHPPAAIASTA